MVLINCFYNYYCVFEPCVESFLFYFKQVSSTEDAEAQRFPEKNHAVQSSLFNSRQKLLTRQPSEGTELAELLAEHQERQLRSMEGLNHVGLHRKRGSSSIINELHVQTNASHQRLNSNGLQRRLEQVPLNNGTMMPVNPGYGVPSQGNPQVMYSGKVFRCEEEMSSM